MTSRERFIETMRFGAPDRVPFLEEGFRDDVLDRWRRQGMPAGKEPAELFGLDRREGVPAHFGPRPAIERWPQSLSDLEEFRRHFDPDDPGRLPEDWPARAAAWRTRDDILDLTVHHGFFLSLGVNDWRRLEEVLYQVGDSPAVVQGMMEIVGECAARLAARVLRDVQVEFALFSEPIAGNDRPLVSPRSYRELILSAYLPIVEALRQGGVQTIVYQTYANARVLLPDVIGAGFNCLWAVEANPKAMDYRDLRREFGRDLRLIGGIDLDCLLAGEDAIRREIEEKVPPLLAEGGYVPLADGRVRVNVPWEAYACYRQVLAEVAGA